MCVELLYTLTTKICYIYYNPWFHVGYFFIQTHLTRYLSFIWQISTHFTKFFFFFCWRDLVFMKRFEVYYFGWSYLVVKLFSHVMFFLKLQSQKCFMQEIYLFELNIIKSVDIFCLLDHIALVWNKILIQTKVKSGVSFKKWYQ